MIGPQLEWRGVLFPEVPASCRLYTGKVSAQLGAAPTAKHYLLQWPAGSDAIFKGTQFPAQFFGPNIRWEGRLIGFGLGAALLATAAHGADQIWGYVEQDEVDDNGNAIVSPPVRSLTSDLVNDGSATMLVESCGDASPEIRPVMSHRTNALRVHDRSRIRIGVSHEPLGPAPATTYVTAIAVFAIFPKPDQLGE